MLAKYYPKKGRNLCACLILLLLAQYTAAAQIYYHNFGTTAISSHPYTMAPTVSDAHFSNSSWTNSLNSWTSNTGATGEAIRLTSTASATVTLTFDIAANFQADITSFDFWRLRSNLGPQNWSMAINGINVGSGTVGTTGANIGNTAVSSPVSGLTGTVTIVISLSGNGGNGTFRLDDFTLNGSVTSTCTTATITSFSPLSGPQNTLVSISGNGFQSGLGTSSVKFNGIAASFNVVSDNLIKAYVPAGNATGNISITTDGCESFAAAAFTELVSASANNYSSDIYISEIYDAQAGDGGVIEIYNGTAAPVNLAGYTIRRYGDIGGPTFYTINLAGIIPPGGVFLVGIGTGTTPCAIIENQHYSTGFNSNDEFQLYNNGVMIDNVHAPLGVGYSVIRNPNAVAPNPVFNSSDWVTSTTENCADIGIHDVTTNTPPPVTSPSTSVICETNAAVFSASIGNPAGYTFQWKTLNASGLWVNVANVAPYSGANSGTLTINPAPVAFNDNQYYCQITSAVDTVVSHAAQLEVNPAIIPDFATTLAICSGETTPILNTGSPNGISGIWNPSVIDNMASGSYTFTPNPGQCAATATLNVTVDALIIPNFATTLAICSGDIVPALNPVSPNGISGTWNPSTISNITSGNYLFTPAPNQCAANATLTVTINNPLVPDFSTSLTLCNGEAAPTLNNISPNGISGIWNPATIDNSNSGSYIFTPNVGQCANSILLSVTIANPVTPNFATALTLCSHQTMPALNTISPNGISGTWNPATIDNLNNGSYIFTPDSGQCANPMTLNVVVQNAITPDFPATFTLCSTDAMPLLQATSPNGISGTWHPSAINNLASGNYIFTPNAGQCAHNFTLSVVIAQAVTADFATSLSLCHGEAVPVLNAVSPNGISGTWNPETISNTTNGSYIFTPNANQCANPMTLSVTINALPQPVLHDAYLCVDNETGEALNPVALYCGVPNAGHSFSWTLNGNPLPTATNTHLAIEPGLYKVVATNPTTGCFATASCAVNISSMAVATVVGGQDFSDNQTLTVHVSGGSGTYQFQLDGGLPQDSNVFHHVGAGEHVITIVDVNGCNPLTINISVLDYPRYFTPNGDGFHDFWNIAGLAGQPQSRICIFDRYGKLLKTLQPSDNSGWDGTYNGNTLPSTDYWFTLFYEDSQNRDKEFKAHFSLKR